VTAPIRPVTWHWRRFASRATGSAEAAFDPRDFSPPLRTRLLILQSTPFCNIDCAYCYLPDRNSTARMSMQTLALAARRLVEDGLLDAELSVVWHAGEPMVLPPGYYEESIGLLQDTLGSRCRLRLSLQTNGLLVTPAWCDLIRRHEISLGVSVDGPAVLHDLKRRTRRGGATHASVVEGMNQLRQAGIPFHAIAVVHAETLRQPDAFLDFFVEQGVREVGCNFDEAEGAHARSSLEGHDDLHRAFLQRLLERTAAPDSAVEVRELAWARRQLLAPAPQTRWRDQRWPENAQVLPFALLSVAHDGGYATFSPELLGQPWREGGHFVLGNVHQSGYLASSNHPMFQQSWRAILQGVHACAASCAHFGYCGGGSPANKHYELGDMAGTETLYCRTMVKRPFDLVLEHAERELALTS